MGRIQNGKETLSWPGVESELIAWKVNMLTVAQTTLAYNPSKYLYIFSYMKLKLIIFN